MCIGKCTSPIRIESHKIVVSVGDLGRYVLTCCCTEGGRFVCTNGVVRSRHTVSTGGWLYTSRSVKPPHMCRTPRWPWRRRDPVFLDKSSMQIVLTAVTYFFGVQAWLMPTSRCSIVVNTAISHAAVTALPRITGRMRPLPRACRQS